LIRAERKAQRAERKKNKSQNSKFKMKNTNEFLAANPKSMLLVK
jgi:hypothetical protein